MKTRRQAVDLAKARYGDETDTAYAKRIGTTPKRLSEWINRESNTLSGRVLADLTELLKSVSLKES